MRLGGIAMIAIFLPSLRGGGAERTMVNLSKGFTECGLKVDLILAKAEGPYLSLVPPEVRIVDLRVQLSPIYAHSRQPLQPGTMTGLLTQNWTRISGDTIAPAEAKNEKGATTVQKLFLGNFLGLQRRWEA